MKVFSRVLFFLVLIAGAGVLFYGQRKTNHSESPSAPIAPIPVTNPTLHAEATPSIQYPVPPETEQPKTSESAARKPLPPVDESDESIGEALTELFGKKRLDAVFNPNHIVRRIVVTLDNIMRHKQPSQEFSPLKELDSSFRVTGKGDKVSIASSNFRRYAPYVALAQSVDAEKLVAVYMHFYPLFQSAFQDLGKPGYFNDRLVHVIDGLLKTPDIMGPIQVIRPSKHDRYKYVDDRLETLSAGQKLLIRMGGENARQIREKLQQIRAFLVHLKR